MLTRLTMVIIVRYINISNHCVVYLGLNIMLCVNYISIKKPPNTCLLIILLSLPPVPLSVLNIHDRVLHRATKGKATFQKTSLLFCISTTEDHDYSSCL